MGFGGPGRHTVRGRPDCGARTRTAQDKEGHRTDDQEQHELPRIPPIAIKEEDAEQDHHPEGDPGQRQHRRGRAGAGGQALQDAWALWRGEQEPARGIRGQAETPEEGQHDHGDAHDYGINPEPKRHAIADPRDPRIVGAPHPETVDGGTELRHHRLGGGGCGRRRVIGHLSSLPAGARHGHAERPWRNPDGDPEMGSAARIRGLAWARLEVCPCPMPPRSASLRRARG